jgi:hypothetical protein
LKEYCGLNKYGFVNLPPESMRVTKQEIAGTNEEGPQEENDELTFEENRFSIKMEAPLFSLDSLISDFKQDSRQSVVLKVRKEEQQNVTLKDFEIISQIGRGAFGKVYLAELKSNS